MECCRANGQCPLSFGRDMTDGPCTNIVIYKVDEGTIQGVDMKGIIISNHAGGIGPKAPVLKPKPGEGFDDFAFYVSDNATEEQRKILEPFCQTHFMAPMARKFLGVKFVKIEIKEENNTVYITSPYYNMEMEYVIGGDGKTPMRVENKRTPPGINSCNVCTSHWSYKDHGKDLEFDQASGQIADFILSGTD
jgi:hypothetical protein